jgi:hypothetical protein
VPHALPISSVIWPAWSSSWYNFLPSPVSHSVLGSYRTIKYENRKFNNTNTEPLHICYILLFILLSPKHNITVTCKVTPCGLVDKYQHPEEPAASTFNHVLPSVLHFLKQLVSEVRNKTDVNALLLFCNATEHYGLTVGNCYSILVWQLATCYSILVWQMATCYSILVWQLATCYSILGLTNVQYFVLGNTMGITVSPLF